MSAHAAGLQPYAIDCFADRDLTDLCPAVRIEHYPRDFAAALAAAPAGPWIYCGGLENYPRLIDRLAGIRPLLGNAGKAVRLARNLDILQQAALAAECLVPKTVSIGSKNQSPNRLDLQQLQAERNSGRRWLRKAVHSSGGHRIEFADALDSLPDPPAAYWPRHYLQQYIEGESLGAVFLAAGGRAALLGVTRQLLGRDFGLAHRFGYAGSLGPVMLPGREIEKLQALGQLLAERCGLCGLFNVDFIRTKSPHQETTLWPVELNPRYSASVEILERASGENSIAQHIAACNTESLLARSWHNVQICGKAIVYARRDVVISPAIENVLANWPSPPGQSAAADLPRIGEPISKGCPVMTVFADGTNLVEVEAELRRRVAAVERQLVSDPP